MPSELRILYLGTDGEAGKRVRDALPDMPVEVQRCSLFSELLEMLEVGPCDLLLIEGCPDAGLLRLLRSKWSNLPVLATAKPDDAACCLAAMRSGVDDVLLLDADFSLRLRAVLAPGATCRPAQAVDTAMIESDEAADGEAAALLWQHGGCCALLDENGRFLSASPAMENLLQAGPGRLKGRQLHDFVDIRDVETRPVSEIGNADTCFMAEILHEGGMRGRLLIGMTSLQDGERSLRLMQARDVTEQHRSSVLASSQTRLVEMIMAGVEPGEVLEALAHSVSEIHPGCLCTVMLADSHSGRLYNAFTPDLPEQVMDLLDGLAISEDGSCCGSAAFLGQRVVSERLADDGLGQQRLQELGFSPTHCVAQPVISASATVLGTLAIYLPSGQLPGDDEFRTLETAANLAGVALDRVTTEKARLEIEARYRNQFEQCPLAMQVYSTDGRALRGNRAWQEMFSERLDGFTDYNILEDQRIVRQGLSSYVRRGFNGEATELPLLRQAMEGGQPTALPFLPWTRCFIYGIDGAEGRPGEVVLVHEDMSDRRRAEDSLRHSEERLRSLVEGTDDLIFTVSRKGVLTAINAAFEKETSHGISNWIGRNPLGLLDGRNHHSVRKMFLAVMRGESHPEIEVSFCSAPGNYRSGSLSAIPIEEDGRISGAFFTLRDNSERRLVEEERLRLLTAIERVDEMIIITDSEGRILYVNPAFERISGYQLQEIRQFTARILRSEEHDDAFFATMWQQLSSGQVWRGEIVNNNASGGQFRVDAAITPIVGSNGEIANYVGVMRDITAKSLLELRLQHTQKMEAIGSLAGGIAHDFNNILSAIIGYTQIVRREVNGNDRMRSNLDNVLQASQRASELVRQILTFSQHRETRHEAVSMQRIVREVLKLIRASLPSTIEIHQSLLDQQGTVHADATQLHQLVMNLCTNAGQAMEDEGGILEVELSRCEISDPAEAASLGIEVGAYQELRVRDTGNGMDPAVQKRIFEPFFTTKETGRGTGLGLSVVHGIVSKLGGTIRVDSTPGLGSEFRVLLPRSENIEMPVVQPDYSNIHGNERVLLVDDEEIVAAMADQALSQLGYSVTRTLNPEDALRLFQLDPQAFDILVTDQTMPGMTGVQLTAEIHAIRADMPVILCTGFSRTVSGDALEKYGLSAFLDKPASPEKLAATIRMVLASENQPQAVTNG